MIAVTPFAAQAANRVALVIGNSNYADAPLKNPANDATDVSNTLEQLGFEVLFHRDANHRQMEEAVKDFGQKALDSEVALFYYAGHGIQNAGRNYLVPVDSGVSREADLRWNTLDVGKVLDEMGYARSGLNIVILDACRNNPLTRSFRSAERGLVRMRDVPQGTLVAYATSPGQVAADGDGRNSPFTAALLKSIKAPGQPLEIVVKNVMAEVKTATAGRQIPWISSSVTIDFYFVPGERNAAGSGTQSGSTEAIFWQSTERCGTPVCYQAYLDAYPKGIFRALAEARIGADSSAPPSKGTTTPTYALTIHAEPADARVRILNIKPVYHDGIQLPSGRYLVEVTKPGYAMRKQWVTLGSSDHTLSVVLDAERGQQVASAVSVAPSRADSLTDHLTGMQFVSIEGGCYQMGSPSHEGGRDDDEKQHQACVSDFALARHEVTVGQFRQFVQATSYRTEAERGDGCFVWTGEKWEKKGNRNWREPGFRQADDHPVACVSWNDAMAIAEWMSTRTGKRYRLPTEAEWEFAARAGSTTARPWGNDADEACGHANAADLTAKQQFSNWTVHNCRDGAVYTSAVGSYRANRHGLYDMLGNLWEWTCSVYDEKYGGAEKSCARGGEDGRRALRGGSWDVKPDWVRSATRYGFTATNRDSNIGFRLAQDL